MNSKEIGIYLKEKRMQKEYTQKELAEILIVTHQVVSRWEKGDSIPEVAMLDKLSELYEVSIDEILQKKSRNTEEKINHFSSKNTFAGSKDTDYKSYLKYSFINLVFFFVFNVIISGIGIGTESELVTIFRMVARLLSFICFLYIDLIWLAKKYLDDSIRNKLYLGVLFMGFLVIVIVIFTIIFLTVSH